MRAQHLFAVSTAWTLVGFCIPGVLGSDLHKVCRRHPVAGASAPAQGEASLSASGGYASAPQTAAAPPPTEAAASSSAVPTGSAAVGSTGTARSASASSVASASDPVSTGSSGNGTSGGSSERMVFAHYMLVTPPLNDDYNAEMDLAKDMGVDAFAVNYGGWDVDFSEMDDRLAKMYTAAEECGFKLFLSMDMTSVTEASMIVDVAKTHAASKAQVYYNDQLLLSTFQNGNVDDVSFDWQTDVMDPLEEAIGKSVYFIPGTTSTEYEKNLSPAYVDGAFSWPHQSTDLAEDKKTDEGFESTAASKDKSWMAGIAPWFFKHFSDDMNWGNLQDSDIFVTRFQTLLTMDVDFIELVTWNDYGESSYFGAADENKNFVDWAYLSHEGFRKMGSYFISAFKEGQQDVMKASNAESNVFMFYRTQSYKKQGSSDELGPPTDAEEEDSIFVASFLTEPADITISNGGKDTSFTAEAGFNMKAVPFQAGSVSLKAATMNGETIADKQGPEITDAPELTNENVVCI